MCSIGLFPHTLEGGNRKFRQRTFTPEGEIFYGRPRDRGVCGNSIPTNIPCQTIIGSIKPSLESVYSKDFRSSNISPFPPGRNRIFQKRLFEFWIYLLCYSLFHLKVLQAMNTKLQFYIISHL